MWRFEGREGYFGPCKEMTVEELTLLLDLEDPTSTSTPFPDYGQ